MRKLGKRKFASGAVRDSNKGKPRPDLISPYFTERLGYRLAFGAEKYKRKESNKWLAFLNAESVQKLEIYIAKECVARVMRNNFGEIILTLQKNKERTEENGEIVTNQELSNWYQIEEQIQQKEKKIRRPSGSHTSGNLDSLLTVTTSLSKRDAAFAEQPDICTLITTMKHQNSEVYSVVSATTVSECLEITLKELKKRLLISSKVSLTELSGDKNWEKGIPTEAFLESLERHLISYKMGRTDEDHAGAIAFNIMGIIHNEEISKLKE